MVEAMRKTEIPPELLKDVVNGFMVGADPEFAILSPPQDTPILNAGANAVQTTMPGGEIGFDHGGRVWEVRPSPSHSAYAVLLNIWRLLRSDQMNKVSQWRWKAGALGGKRQGHPFAIDPLTNAVTHAPGRPDCLGGHVHFDLDHLTPTQIKLMARITTRLEDLDVLPLEEGRARRALHVQGDEGITYGSLNDVRTPNGHVEYRAPSSWLCNPGQALAVLTTYKLAAARPDTCTWPGALTGQKREFLDWLERLSTRDADALLVSRLIEKRGFAAIQGDPLLDFKPQWRKEELWR